MRRILPVLLPGLLLASAPAMAEVTLRGSPSSMKRQYNVAQEHDFTFLRSADQVERFVEEGYLVPVEGGDDYAVARGVSFPFARPELRLFLERLGAQHRAACGQKLVVTSLTRPTAGQPSNAHRLSVHPAGMAVDLRVSDSSACREWLENTLLALEKRELLDVTRERNPPHYHVALFPGAYAAHAQRQIEAERQAEAEARRLAAEAAAEAQAAAAAAPPSQAAAAAPTPGDSGRGWAALAALPLLAVPIARRLRRRR